jgi:dissimilatory sulfite reductase (desulfoviridin) alpha/beta subunit
MGTNIDYKKLKSGGFILQKDPKYFTVRLRIPSGAITSEQMIRLGEIANKYGRGDLHFTTRQGIQIPWVELKSLGDITNELEEIGVPPGSCGPRVRNVMACVGFECQNALVETYKLAEKIDERYFGKELPGKIKIAVTGCPNSCAKPQLNDIGVMGVAKPKVITELCDACGLCIKTCKESAITLVDNKAVVDYEKCNYCGACIQICPTDAKVADLIGYTIFVGGNVGRHPRFADKIKEFADETTVIDVIDKSIKLFQDEGKPLERFGVMIDRIGLDEFKKIVLH